jgi:hypothetical protein
MQMLTNDWLTNDPIDFEYKKYVLLAYNQRQIKFHNEKKIYPYFTDIIDKLKIVNEFLHNIKLLEDSNVKIVDINWIKKTLNYASKIDDSSLDEIKSTARYSKEVLVDLYSKYRTLLDSVDESIVVSGCRTEIFNLYNGYIILKYDGREKILEYNVYRKLIPHPHFVLKTSKANINEYYTKRYVRNVFDVIFKEHYPMKESILPIYKNKFLETLFGFNL